MQALVWKQTSTIAERMADERNMYVAVGTYRLKPGEARLEFPTLDAAMAKLRDWIEADETDEDEDAPMFSKYAILVNPPKRPVEDPPQGLRLVRD